METDNDSSEQQKKNSVFAVLKDTTNQKMTADMRVSLQRLHDALLCPLCHELIQTPSSLASCSHTFCRSCIDTYTCDAWVCPVEGCGMPVSEKGGRQGCYFQINPSVQTVVTSLTNICTALSSAPDQWWKEEEEEENGHNQDGQQGSQQNDAAALMASLFSSQQSSQQSQEGEEEEEEEEIIDLQAASRKRQGMEHCDEDGETFTTAESAEEDDDDDSALEFRSFP